MRIGSQGSTESPTLELGLLTISILPKTQTDFLKIMYEPNT